MVTSLLSLTILFVVAVDLRGCYLCVQSSCSFCRPISLSLSSRLDLVLRYFALVLFFVYYFFLYDVRLY